MALAWMHFGSVDVVSVERSAVAVALAVIVASAVLPGLAVVLSWQASLAAWRAIFYALIAN